MLQLNLLASIIEVIIVTVPVLLSVAFLTVAERKTMASMQRRLGPNIIGFYGSLQAFADALKLLLKEYISPTQANLVLFFLAPIATLIFSLLGFSVIPFGPGLALSDFYLGILYMLAVSSLATYGILLAGWSANSKYAFLGSLRSTAQLISYELILSSAILLAVLLSGSLNLTVNTQSQGAIFYILPLLPIFIIFFIGSIAETNRAPFDLAEAESELVSGFMTEHAAVIFVFFFLAEYASILLICILTSILFLGGYLLYLGGYSFYLVLNVLFSYFHTVYLHEWFNNDTTKYTVSSSNPLLRGITYGLSLGFKSLIMVFMFIWARASFPRIRYDQLMSFCWIILLPLIIAFIILFPCTLYGFENISANTFLFILPLIKRNNNNSFKSKLFNVILALSVSSLFFLYYRIPFRFILELLDSPYILSIILGFISVGNLYVIRKIMQKDLNAIELVLTFTITIIVFFLIRYISANWVEIVLFISIIPGLHGALFLQDGLMLTISNSSDTNSPNATKFGPNHMAMNRPNSNAGPSGENDSAILREVRKRSPFAKDNEQNTGTSRKRKASDITRTSRREIPTTIVVPDKDYREGDTDKQWEWKEIGRSVKALEDPRNDPSDIANLKFIDTKLRNLLKDTSCGHAGWHLVRPIPQPGDAMVPINSGFWQLLQSKHEVTGNEVTIEGLKKVPVLNRMITTDSTGYEFRGNTMEEKLSVAEHAMNSIHDSLRRRNWDNQSEKYYRLLHEYMASRHFYQLNKLRIDNVPR